MATIFLAGVYGVGKTTLGEKISACTGIAYYSAGDLISNENGEKYGANKVVMNKERNQNILVKCVADILLQTDLILLAGHFCIVNGHNEIDTLPFNVFHKLQLSKIVLLESDCQIISEHLSIRDKKNYPSSLIQELKKQERQAAYVIAHQLDCPLVIHQMTYSDTDVEELIPQL